MGLFCLEPHWCQWRKHQSVHEWVKIWTFKIQGRNTWLSRVMHILTFIWQVNSGAGKLMSQTLSRITELNNTMYKNPQNWKGNPKTVAAWLGLTIYMDYAECESLHIELNPCHSVTWAKPCKINFYLGNIHRCFTEWGRWGLDRKAILRNVLWSHWSALRSSCFKSKALVFYLLQV